MLILFSLFCIWSRCLAPALYIHLSCEFVCYRYILVKNCPVVWLHSWIINHSHVQTFPYFQVRPWVTEADPLWINRGRSDWVNWTCVLSQGLSSLLPSVIWTFILNMHYSLIQFSFIYSGLLTVVIVSKQPYKVTHLNPQRARKQQQFIEKLP